ncbi:MAG: chromate transporter [Eubacteriales bacterium]
MFWAFFQVGLFSIGGGYAAIPLIYDQVVNTYAWLNMNEFSDIITISQMTPGPIAINCATFVGIRIIGIGGAITATLGCVLPSCAIVLILAILYKKYRYLKYVQGILDGLRPAVVGMIASAGLAIILVALWRENTISFDLHIIDYVAVILIAVCVLFLRKTKINPTFIMLGAGVLGGLIYNLI